MTIVFNGHTFKYEIESLCKMFFSCVRFNIEYDTADFSKDDLIFTRIKKGAKRTLIYAFVNSNNEFYKKVYSIDNEATDYSNECERILGLAVHHVLSQFVGTSTKWGILTGIRPVKRIHQYLEQGKTEQEIKAVMREKYLVSDAKTDLCIMTAKRQKSIIEDINPKYFSLYISIPFCPSRCSYCSFVSHSIANKNAQSLIPSYVEHLCKEIAFTGKMAKELGLILKTVYFGGGTPTTLSAHQLSAIMSCVEQNFDLNDVCEYTVEAGRPDTITEEKLRTLKDFGITRISINPQTFNDDVLKAIGRNHNSQLVVDCYELARKIGFNNINMDLIAGLPSDYPESFRNTIDKTISLGPENITVHTLSVKRSSNLFDEKGLSKELASNPTGEMVDYAQKKLLESAYAPYYLYRQKNTLENLENVGYAKKGFEGLYNVYIMEEMHTILAIGASAATKLVDPKTNLIERIFNYKFPFEYINLFGTIIDRKSGVTKFYEKYHHGKNKD
ncbi:MAG: Coproporphyrinogen dehydrogenase [Oscillospiraceae bacterium]|jgi:oxygen-independent coproporphyrinogen-3 oxidase|nr:Coproporphyrinogen dehydrogenase [Oscillospiraceae bacterium]